ncbi:glycosyltransferase [Polynucleobacter yangtzensis]|uniref:glycosyltransferase n=1 Tax=Polynucleobacter yangtzensis TaxID=1743159 RepID=UPI0008308D69|nr:glycosyltransferase [Polynucleobacter yangtzensis]
MKNNTVHFLWVNGDLNKIGKLSLSSFKINKFNPILWTYSKNDINFCDIEIRDANEILDYKKIFKNKKDSYASFSDLFRYTVLMKCGGIWADTDVISLKDCNQLDLSKAFLVQEYDKFRKLKLILNKNNTVINNNIICLPNPEAGNIIDLARAYSEVYRKDLIEWSELGPKLLSGLVKMNPHHGFILKKPVFSNPFPFWKIPKILLEPHVKIPPSAHFLHCYNECWRNFSVDPNAEYPVNSIMSKLELKYLDRK